MAAVKLVLALSALLASAAVPHARPDGGDTLLYHVAVLPSSRHLSVEARLVLEGRSAVSLRVPPRAAAGGTAITAFAATDSRGAPLRVQHTGSAFVIEDAPAGGVRFRYRLEFTDSITGGSTSSGLDSVRLYAVAPSVFVAPDPTAYRKTGGRYPDVRIRFAVPRGWTVATGWRQVDGEHRPSSGDDLVTGVVAAAPDYRTYSGAVGTSTWVLAVRGSRAFTDSALAEMVAAGLRLGAATLGPVPVARVTYVSDVGRKGRTSGSLQGLATIGLLWEPGEMLDRPRGHDTFHETLHLWFGGALEAEGWWTEGVTDYLAARLYAQWRGSPEDLAFLCYQSLRNYERIPHRLRLTMAEERRRSIAGDNTQLLVYRKGMLAGLILDAAMRRGSGGRASLDDAARRLLTLGAGRPSRTVTEADIREVVVGLGGRDAAEEWSRVVAGTSAVTVAQVASALRQVTGVEFRPPRVRVPKALSNTSNLRATQ